MRRRLILIVLAVATATLAATAWISIAMRTQSLPPRAESRNSGPAAVDRGRPAETSSIRVTPTINAQPAVSTDNLTHARYVSERVAELNALAMKNDTGSRDIILSELQNSDEAIREGAREATIQFGDRSVIPRLQEVADQTDDTDEKKALLDAIEYLKLPSLTEYLASHPAQQSSAGLTNSARLFTNRLGRHPRVQ